MIDIKATLTRLLAHDHETEVLEFKEAKNDFEKILLDKLPDILDETQKKNKVKNLLPAMRKSGNINVLGKIWTMSKKMNG